MKEPRLVFQSRNESRMKRRQRLVFESRNESRNESRVESRAETRVPRRLFLGDVPKSGKTALLLDCYHYFIVFFIIYLSFLFSFIYHFYRFLIISLAFPANFIIILSLLYHVFYHFLSVGKAAWIREIIFFIIF